MLQQHQGQAKDIASKVHFLRSQQILLLVTAPSPVCTSSSGVPGDQGGSVTKGAYWSEVARSLSS